MDVVKTVDCKGLTCPEPILVIKAAMADVESGQIVEMTATDPGSVNDMEAWSRRTGHRIVDRKQEGNVFTFYVEKK